MNIGSDRAATARQQLWDEPEDRRIALCRAFYEHVIADAFPKREQAEEPETWLPLTSPPTPSGKPHVDMILACASASEVKAEAVVGIHIIFKYDPMIGILARNLYRRPPNLAWAKCGGGIFFCLNEIGDRRARAVSALAFSGCSRKSVAVTRRGTCPCLSPFVIPDSGSACRDCRSDYVQPPLAPEKPPCRDLLLLCDPRPDGSGATAYGIVEFLVNSMAPSISRMRLSFNGCSSF